MQIQIKTPVHLLALEPKCEYKKCGKFYKQSNGANYSANHKIVSTIRLLMKFEVSEPRGKLSIKKCSIFHKEYNLMVVSILLSADWLRRCRYLQNFGES